MMMVRKSKGLGERHQKILDFLEAYQRANKYPPSIREIGEKTGITSTSVVNYYLDQLEKRGMIERDPQNLTRRAPCRSECFFGYIPRAHPWPHCGGSPPPRA